MDVPKDEDTQAAIARIEAAFPEFERVDNWDVDLTAQGWKTPNGDILYILTFGLDPGNVYWEIEWKGEQAGPKGSTTVKELIDILSVERKGWI